MAFKNAQTDCILPQSFFEGRNIPNFHPNSLDSRQWWGEQVRRCKEGWSDGGFSMTPAHYFHCNFRNMRMVGADGRRDSFKPYYSISDDEVFKLTDHAKSVGEGILLITGRGWGKSYFTSSIADHQAVMYPTSEVIISASISKYADLLWRKCMEGLNSLPEALRPTLLVDRDDEIETGYKVKINGKEEIRGYRSVMKKIIFGDDAGKTRGGRPDIHIFEEIGSWKNLISCYNMSAASWWVGSQYTCLPILIGTGGEMKSGKSGGAKLMFYDPAAYHLTKYQLPDRDVKTSIFIPAYCKFGGMYEKTGVSDEVAAKEFLNKRREDKAANIEVYNQEVQEFPFSPEEAFFLSGSNTFPTAALQKQMEKIFMSETLQNIVQRGDLHWVKDGSVVTGVRFEANPKGDFEILEHPHYEGMHIPKWLYVSGCDSYDSFGAEDETGEEARSKGSIFMYKRIIDPLDPEANNKFVAKCTLRDKDSNKFYEATAKLNMYYYGGTPMMLYEHTKVGIMDWYNRNKLLHLLYERPKIAYDGIQVKKSVANNKYGLAMPDKIKKFTIDGYSKWMYDPENVENSGYSRMYFVSQMEDAINFIWGSSKHDETMAAALAIVVDNDLFHVAVKKEPDKPVRFPRYVRDSLGNMRFV